MTNCTYFVEGLCEKQLIDSIKNTDLHIPEKVKSLQCRTGGSKTFSSFIDLRWVYCICV